jgi:hypothetical protein
LAVHRRARFEQSPQTTAAINASVYGKGVWPIRPEKSFQDLVMIPG